MKFASVIAATALASIAFASQPVVGVTLYYGLNCERTNMIGHINGPYEKRYSGIRLDDTRTD